MEIWIFEHPWWTAFIVYSLLALGAMFAVWRESGTDEYGLPETTTGGYVATYFLWWLSPAVAILSWLFPGRDPSKRQNREP